MPKFLNTVELVKNTLDSAKIQNSSSAPSSPVAGQFYFNTTTNRLFVYTGTQWNPASNVRDSRAKDNTGAIRFTIPGIELSSSSTTTLAINQLRYAPFIVRTPIIIDLLSVEVTTAVALATIRMGVYKADSDLQPTTLVTDAGEIDASTTGVKSISVSLNLDPGTYLTALNVNVAGVAVRIARGGSMYAGLNASMGSTPFTQSFRVPTAYATLADPGATWASSGGAGNPMEFMIFMRVSTP